MKKRKGIKTQKNTFKKKLSERKNYLVDVKTQLQTMLQLLEQEQQEIIHMENQMLGKLKLGGENSIDKFGSPIGKKEGSI